MYDFLLSGTRPLGRTELQRLLKVTSDTLTDAIQAGFVPRPSYWVLAMNGRWRRCDLLRWIDTGGYHAFLQWSGEHDYVACPG